MNHAKSTNIRTLSSITTTLLVACLAFDRAPSISWIAIGQAIFVTLAIVVVSIVRSRSKTAKNVENNTSITEVVRQAASEAAKEAINGSIAAYAAQIAAIKHYDALAGEGVLDVKDIADKEQAVVVAATIETAKMRVLAAEKTLEEINSAIARNDTYAAEHPLSDSTCTNERRRLNELRRVAETNLETANAAFNNLVAPFIDPVQ